MSGNARRQCLEEQFRTFCAVDQIVNVRTVLALFHSCNLRAKVRDTTGPHLLEIDRRKKRQRFRSREAFAIVQDFVHRIDWFRKSKPCAQILEVRRRRAQIEVPALQLQPESGSAGSPKTKYVHQSARSMEMVFNCV